MSEEEIARLPPDYFPYRILRLDKLGLFKIAPMSRVQQMIFYKTLYKNQSDLGLGGPPKPYLFDNDNLIFWKDWVLDHYTKDGKRKGVVVPHLPEKEQRSKLRPQSCLADTEKLKSKTILELYHSIDEDIKRLERSNLIDTSIFSFFQREAAIHHFAYQSQIEKREYSMVDYLREFVEYVKTLPVGGMGR